MIGDPYPQRPASRDRWVLARRDQALPAARHELDPQRPYAFLLEHERAADGDVLPVATVFLTNRECPFRCLMCDLWRNTLTVRVPIGAIPAQIDHALARLPPARQIKLYNSGSFFDPGAIPNEDHAAIAQRVHHFDRVIVECHPAFVDDRCVRFQQMLSERGTAQLEVAIGLETAHPQVLEKLNKRMTLAQFKTAAELLRRHSLALRVFVLVKPPYLDDEQALVWARRSLDFAFDCGATVVTLIPTRSGNGALETLTAAGDFSKPQLATLEAALTYGINLGRGRVFADLWDLQQFAACDACFNARAERLSRMNLQQTIMPRVECHACGVNR